MWHRRFGHASFGYTKRLFPSLFSDCNPSVFHCDVCVLAKSHHTTYPLSFSKMTVPFALIHSDVWVCFSFYFLWILLVCDFC